MSSGLCASFGYMIDPCGVITTCGVIDLLLIKYRQMVSV